MPQINDDDYKASVMGFVKDPVAAHSVGTQAMQFSVQWLALGWVLGDGMKGFEEALIKRTARAENTRKLLLCLTGQLDLIHALGAGEGFPEKRSFRS